MPRLILIDSDAKIEALIHEAIPDCELVTCGDGETASAH